MDENPYKSPESVSDRSPTLNDVVPIRRTAARGAVFGAATFGVATIVSISWVTSDANFPGGDRVAQSVSVLQGTAIGAIFGGIVGTAAQAIVNFARRKIAD